MFVLPKTYVMTFADLFNNLLESSRERIKNPLFNSIFCSFIFFNWRPIALLLFSELPIEERIGIIDSKYCYPLAFLLPILFGVIYTNYIPTLMVFLDKNLEDAKKDKITNFYVYKEHRIDQQLQVAKKEFDLQNVQNGNKDREELVKERDLAQNERDILKNQILDSNEGNSKIIKELNSQLVSLRETYQNLKTSTSEEITDLKDVNAKAFDRLNISNSVLGIIANLDTFDLQTLKSIEQKTTIDGEYLITAEEENEISSILKSIDRLSEFKLINNDRNHDGISISSFGMVVLERIKNINSDYLTDLNYNRMPIYEEIVNGKLIKLGIGGVLRSMLITEEGVILEAPQKRLNFLLENGFIQDYGGEMRLTPKGQNIINII